MPFVTGSIVFYWSKNACLLLHAKYFCWLAANSHTSQVLSLSLTLLAAGANAAAPATREAMMAVFILIFDSYGRFYSLLLAMEVSQAGGQVEPRTRRSFQLMRSHP